MKRLRHHKRIPSTASMGDITSRSSSVSDVPIPITKMALMNDASRFSGSGVIGGQAFYDANNDGMRDHGDHINGVPDINVWLYSCNPRKWLAHYKTPSNGIYRFVNLAPGNYYVAAQPPMGYQFSSDGRINDISETTFDPKNGRTVCFHLGDGEKTMDWSFGMYQHPESPTLNPSEKRTDLPSGITIRIRSPTLQPSRISNSSPTFMQWGVPTFIPSNLPSATTFNSASNLATISPNAVIPKPNTASDGIPNVASKPVEMPSPMPPMVPSLTSSYYIPSESMPINPISNPVATNQITPNPVTNSPAISIENGHAVEMSNFPSHMPSELIAANPFMISTLRPSIIESGAHQMSSLETTPTQKPTRWTILESDGYVILSSDSTPSPTTMSQWSVSDTLPKMSHQGITVDRVKSHAMSRGGTSGSSGSIDDILVIICGMVAFLVIAATISIVIKHRRRRKDHALNTATEANSLIFDGSRDSSSSSSNNTFVASNTSFFYRKDGYANQCDLGSVSSADSLGDTSITSLLSLSSRLAPHLILDAALETIVELQVGELGDEDEDCVLSSRSCLPGEEITLPHVLKCSQVAHSQSHELIEEEAPRMTSEAPLAIRECLWKPEVRTLSPVGQGYHENGRTHSILESTEDDLTTASDTRRLSPSSRASRLALDENLDTICIEPSDEDEEAAISSKSHSPEEENTSPHMYKFLLPGPSPSRATPFESRGLIEETTRRADSEVPVATKRFPFKCVEFKVYELTVASDVHSSVSTNSDDESINPLRTSLPEEYVQSYSGSKGEQTTCTSRSYSPDDAMADVDLMIGTSDDQVFLHSQSIFQARRERTTRTSAPLCSLSTNTPRGSQESMLLQSQLERGDSNFSLHSQSTLKAQRENETNLETTLPDYQNTQACPLLQSHFERGDEEFDVLTRTERENIAILEEDVRMLSLVMDSFPKGSQQWLVLNSNLDLAKEDLDEIMQDVQIRYCTMQTAEPSRKKSGSMARGPRYDQSLHPSNPSQDRDQLNGKVYTIDGEDVYSLSPFDVGKLLRRIPQKAELELPIVCENEVGACPRPSQAKHLHRPCSVRLNEKQSNEGFSSLSESTSLVKLDEISQSKLETVAAQSLSNGSDADLSTAIDFAPKKLEEKQNEVAPPQIVFDSTTAVIDHVKLKTATLHRLSNEVDTDFTAAVDFTSMNLEERQNEVASPQIVSGLTLIANDNVDKSVLRTAKEDRKSLYVRMVPDEDGVHGRVWTETGLDLEELAPKRNDKGSSSTNEMNDEFTASQSKPRAVTVQSSPQAPGSESDGTAAPSTVSTKPENGTGEAAVAPCYSDLMSDMKQFLRKLDQDDDGIVAPFHETTPPTLTGAGLQDSELALIEERLGAHSAVEEEVKSWYAEFCRKKSEERKDRDPVRKLRGVPFEIPIMMWAQRKEAKANGDGVVKKENGLGIVEEETEVCD